MHLEANQGKRFYFWHCSHHHAAYLHNAERRLDCGVQRCSACFRRLPVNPMFCRACAAVAYCSAACRDSDAHEPGGPECGVPWSALLPDNARLALRLALKLVLSSVAAGKQRQWR